MKNWIGIAICLVAISGLSHAQGGSSLAFTISTTGCQGPTKGSAVLCGTANDITVSFDGASPLSFKGSTATVAIGTVTTIAAGTPAKVTDSGTPQAAILNFSIPAGQNGTNGKDGAVGATGAKGDKGDTGAAGKATLVNAICSLKFTGGATTDGSVPVIVTCQ